ncbi:glycosyltransferase family 2 protein [Candidatus Parcubacteria bacterium]|nr:glycosyltransferase family 2 protein [Candidatus Parcubacteria bacterium]
MKLIVQVPCYNEAATLPLVINSIPKRIPGISKVETLIVDDGSSDSTLAVAQDLGVDHIVRHRQNKGLAVSFADGFHEALKQGADIIVNTDGDNQYPQESIPQLIQPILDGSHDIVVGDRQTSSIAHFGPFKKLLQRFGSRVVNAAAGTNIPDAPSGFRAYSREAAMSVNLITSFSYCMETIIHAGRKRIAITHVPVKTNPKTRESRLFKNIFQHVAKSGSAIIRAYAMHQPFRIFLASGLVVFTIGLVPYIRMGYLMLSRGELIGGHLQSLILGAVFIILGFLFVVIGVVADLLSINRKLLEDTLHRLKRIEYDGKEEYAEDHDAALAFKR